MNINYIKKTIVYYTSPVIIEKGALDTYEGKRNQHRILWSNDGLIFVTYDHYATFYEIIGENYGEENNYIRLN